VNGEEVVQFATGCALDPVARFAVPPMITRVYVMSVVTEPLDRCWTNTIRPLDALFPGVLGIGDN